LSKNSKTMIQLCADLQAEYAALASLGQSLTPAQWRTPTLFHGWTPWDEIAHICLIDDVGALAATDEAAFASQAAALRQRRLAGEEISAIARATYQHLDGPQLIAHWTPIYTRLVQALTTLDPKDRLPWFGPSMSARSFATARLMETWAHGQDVYDALRLQRPVTPRLQHIAHLGVTTFGWTFQNRGLPVPDTAPHVVLDGPEGVRWEWNPPSATHHVHGSAQEFCWVVTQRRHVSDTQLQHSGYASTWLEMAQCFAGPPSDGPAPGVRRV
jgi:uncharacterized protein (TIGR03084 family)